MEPYPDMATKDFTTLPREDPKVVEALAKEMEKTRKAREDAAKREEKEMRAMQKKTASLTPAKGPHTHTQASPQVKAREVKLHKIRMYFSKLGHKLSVKEPKVYPKTDEAIDELLSTIQTELYSNGGIEKAGMGYIMAVNGVEEMTKVFNPLGWQLRGPAASLTQTVVQNQKEWDELVTEFAIEHSEWFMMGPGKRLIATTLQLIHTVDRANKMALTAATRPPSEDLKEKGEDL